MPDICIFYSEPDKNNVAALASIFDDLGWSVWWDEKITNGRWNSEIEQQIDSSKCVITIWNSKAANVKSVTFAEAEMCRQLNKPMVTLISEDNFVPPLPFNVEHITTNICKWDLNPSALCVIEIIESLESILGTAPSKWNGERPEMMNLRGKQIKLPCFVKSLSSHETQLDPEAGLTVLGLFPEVDALLISAYDFHISEKLKEDEKKSQEYMCEQLEALDKQGTFILMDSGNYEKSRKEDELWTVEEFNWTLENVPFTYAFCFDNLEPSLDPIENALDVISRVEGEFEDKLIPIIHAPEDKDGNRHHSLLPDIFYEFASRKKSPFIAVPERELGEGITEKVDTIIKIREKLNALGHYQPIHILGTGNPLSILILSAAGADLFDGLEWCRTVADKETGFLFHHQQFDFFQAQSKTARFGIVREAMTSPDATLQLKLGMHNLDFFYDWMEELQEHINQGSVSEMLKYRMMFNSRGIVDELKELMPGLFK